MKTVKFGTKIGSASDGFFEVYDYCKRHRIIISEKYKTSVGDYILLAKGGGAEVKEVAIQIRESKPLKGSAIEADFKVMPGYNDFIMSESWTYAEVIIVSIPNKITLTGRYARYGLSEIKDKATKEDVANNVKMSIDAVVSEFAKLISIQRG